MVWQELSIKVPWEYAEPVSYLFGKYGHGLSMETAGENAGDGQVLLRTYLDTDISERRLARIEVGINLISLLQPMGDLVIKEMEDADWETAWKAHFSLLKLGKRLVIKPSWIEYRAKDDDIVIELDPGLAFGTGYHPTTRMCLEALEELVRPGMDVLDLGTGSGILSIAATALGAASVLAIDVDPTAVRAARKNFRATGASDKVRLATGTLPHRLAGQGRFDLAVANISAKIIQDKATDLFQALKPGGTLIASGIIQDQQQSLEDALIGAGFSPMKTHQVDDWVALLLNKPR
jgi:ribosomal protein L11 methyltransferase